ncbi:MAG: hypothetical protein FJY11_03285 [Bacteroidetes bacterium]|nr:hypothetical protein [Bacteroidota bacterium]
MKRSFLLTAVFLYIAVVQGISGQSADTLRAIDELFAQYHNGMPGVAVAIERDGKVIYNKAFGIANLEHMVPNTTETVFEAGSVSKQFTAAAMLLLIQEGKLSVNDDVRKYVPELPDYGTPITIRHIFSHTSGLKDWGSLYGITGWPRTTRVYTQDLSFDIIFRQKSLNFIPGSQYSYSNSNYVLQALIVERITGKTLEQFTIERLFEPLGMKDTRWRSDQREIVKRRAVAYSGNQMRFLQNMPNENVHGPGGLLTTNADLLRWNRLLETPEIFTGEIARLRVEPGMLTSGRSAGYAAGLMIGEWNGFDEISHSGATGGYRAWLAWYPDKKLSVAILSNYASFDPAGAGRNIASIFLGRPVPGARMTVAVPGDGPFVPTAAMSEYAGSYYSEDVDVTYKLEVRNGELWVYRKAGDTFRLNPTGQDAFRSVSNGTYEFDRDRRGRITGFRVSVSRASNVPFRKL